MKLDYTNCPEEAVGPVGRYLELGLDPGPYYLAVLENDLTETLTRMKGVDWIGGSETVRALCRLIHWLRVEAPAIAWGNRNAVTYWLDVGGAEGIEAKLGEHRRNG